MISGKLKIISNDKLKSVGISLFLKNLTNEDLQYKILHYKDNIKYNFLYEKTDFTASDIYIVSASFQEYLEPIFPKNVKILASTMIYKDNNVEGLEFNCYGKNKIKILQDININEIDIFYTDSISDLPLVKISKKTILIKNNTEYECSDINDFIRKAK